MFNQQIKTSALSLCLMSCMSVLYSAEAFAQNGKSGATYSRKNGVTTRRNANGTVDVIDQESIYAPHTSPGFRNGKGGATYSRKNGVTTRRNADGTVDVIDSQGFRPGQRSSGMRANVGSYVRSSGGSTVKRNAN